jgi:hypothetical protein
MIKPLITVTIQIQWFAYDCFDIDEYPSFHQMIYCTYIYNYNIMQNPHVKVDDNKISLVRHSSSFTSNKTKLYEK